MKRRYIGTWSKNIGNTVVSMSKQDPFGINSLSLGNVQQYRIIAWSVTNATEAYYEYTAYVPYFTNFFYKVPLPPMTTVNLMTADNGIFFDTTVSHQLQPDENFHDVQPSNAGGLGMVTVNVTVEAQEITEYSG